MFQIPGPAVLIAAILGYIGIDTIVHAIGNLFEKQKGEDPENKR